MLDFYGAAQLKEKLMAGRLHRPAADFSNELTPNSLLAAEPGTNCY
jgi:hypothetical protein